MSFANRVAEREEEITKRADNITDNIADVLLKEFKIGRTNCRERERKREKERKEKKKRENADRARIFRSSANPNIDSFNSLKHQ